MQFPQINVKKILNPLTKINRYSMIFLYSLNGADSTAPLM